MERKGDSRRGDGGRWRKEETAWSLACLEPADARRLDAAVAVDCAAWSPPDARCLDASVAPVRTVPTATGSWPSKLGAGATGSQRRRRRSKWHQGGAAMALRRRGGRRHPSPRLRPLPVGRALAYPVTGILARSVRDPRAGSTSVETSVDLAQSFYGPIQSNSILLYTQPIDDPGNWPHEFGAPFGPWACTIHSQA
jgi:hypothetical protein